MYLAIVLSTMLIFPLLSGTIATVFFPGPPMLTVFASWFLFWAVGVRLLGAGLRQVFQPSFTAEQIFEIKDPSAQVIVRELGFANIGAGQLALISFFVPAWHLPAAFIGLAFYGFAGINHLFKKKNRMEMIATVSDLYAAAVLVLVFFV